MSLLKPHLGDILDRYATVCMKLAEGRQRLPEAEWKHFEEEASALHKAVVQERTRHDYFYAADLMRAVELGTVLGRMWEMNKAARESCQISLKEIHVFNDRRAELVRLLGDAPKDKVY